MHTVTHQPDTQDHLGTTQCHGVTVPTNPLIVFKDTALHSWFPPGPHRSPHSPRGSHVSRFHLRLRLTCRVGGDGVIHNFGERKCGIYIVSCFRLRIKLEEKRFVHQLKQSKWDHIQNVKSSKLHQIPLSQYQHLQENICKFVQLANLSFSGRRRGGIAAPKFAPHEQHLAKYFYLCFPLYLHFFFYLPILVLGIAAPKSASH